MTLYMFYSYFINILNGGYFSFADLQGTNRMDVLCVLCAAGETYSMCSVNHSESEAEVKNI